VEQKVETPRGGVDAQPRHAGLRERRIEPIAQVADGGRSRGEDIIGVTVVMMRFSLT
jgi:hypothetical protein